MNSTQFNNLYPVGTDVKYYPRLNDISNFAVGKTTSPAWELGHGATVVGTDIMGGGLMLSHIAVIDTIQMTQKTDQNETIAEENDDDLIGEDEIPF